jgi:hypothetical protein
MLFYIKFYIAMFLSKLNPHILEMAIKIGTTIIGMKIIDI